MIDVTEYLFIGAGTLEAPDVVTAGTDDALRIQVNIVQNVYCKVAVIHHVPVISGMSIEKPVTLLYIARQAVTNLIIIIML